jgi:hypothetical protein
MKAKLGPEAATMATAHKIAVIFYTMVKNQVEYDETIWETRDTQREKRLEAKLKRQAKQLGYELVVNDTRGLHVAELTRDALHNMGRYIAGARSAGR